MANDLPEAECQKVLSLLAIRSSKTIRQGPIRTLVEAEHFDRIHLLSNYPPFLAKGFAKWLSPAVVIHQVDIDAPTDYVSIFPPPMRH